MATTLASPTLPAAAPACDALPTVDTTTVTVLLTSFAGLGLPRTLSLPLTSTTPISQVRRAVLARLPASAPTEQLILTTSSNKLLRAGDHNAVSSLLSDSTTTLLPLRLSARLCGGKGGFGSQLRAAGGRMSSKKSRNQQQNVHGSNRNLDGRRLRTIDEAKRLAEYLATKPEMERREKEERRKRWEAVVEAAEATEQRIKQGKLGSNQGRLDAGYVESKEQAEEKVRDAVARAMREQMVMNERTGSESSESAAKDEDDEGGEESSGSSEEVVGPKEVGGTTFFGWDEDEELSDDEDEAVKLAGTELAPAVAKPDESPPLAYEGKGKGKAV